MSSIKPQVGHTLSASGAIEAIICVETIRAGMVPATANFDEVDPRCDLDYVVEGPRKHPVEICLSTSLAFGGSNAALIFRRYR